MGPSSLVAPGGRLLGAGTGSSLLNWAGGDGIPGGRCLAAFEQHLVKWMVQGYGRIYNQDILDL